MCIIFSRLSRTVQKSCVCIMCLRDPSRRGSRTFFFESGTPPPPLHDNDEKNCREQLNRSSAQEGNGKMMGWNRIRRKTTGKLTFWGMNETV